MNVAHQTNTQINIQQSKKSFVSYCEEHQIIGERFDLNDILGLPVELLSHLDFIKIGCGLNLHPDVMHCVYFPCRMVRKDFVSVFLEW